MGNTDDNFQQQQQQQQQMSRSYSLDFPMELKRNHFTLRNYENTTPRMRHSLNQQTNRQRVNADKTNRLSLNNHGDTKNSQVLLRNRQVCTIFLN